MCLFGALVRDAEVLGLLLVRGVDGTCEHVLDNVTVRSLIQICSRSGSVPQFMLVSYRPGFVLGPVFLWRFFVD